MAVNAVRLEIVRRIHLVQVRDNSHSLVNMVMKFWVTQNGRNFRQAEELQVNQKGACTIE